MRIAQVAPLYESCPPQLYGGTERVVSYLTEGEGEPCIVTGEAPTYPQLYSERLKKKIRFIYVEGGGSFGRHLFSDAAYEAAEVSRLFGMPVQLMWHRTDDFRHGRTHPMCTSRVRAIVLGGNVLTYEQRNTSVATDFTHGIGEIITAMGAKLPGGDYYAETPKPYRKNELMPEELRLS